MINSKEIEKFIDKQKVSFICSIDNENYPNIRAMLKPRKRIGLKEFYFSTNTSSLKVKQYRENPNASIYFCHKGIIKYIGVMLKGKMKILTDQETKNLLWQKGDKIFYKKGATDPDYCVLKFTATSGRYYSDLKTENFDVDNLIIRQLQPHEYQILNDFLYEAIFVPKGTEKPPKDIINQPELQVYVKDFGQLRGDYAMVAEDNGKIVGVCWARIMNDYGHLDDQTPSLAISLYQNYRGRGLGTKLTIALLKLLKAKGYQRVSLSVQKENHRAIKMYQKVGLKTISENNTKYLMIYDHKKR